VQWLLGLVESMSMSLDEASQVLADADGGGGTGGGMAVMEGTESPAGMMV